MEREWSVFLLINNTQGQARAQVVLERVLKGLEAYAAAGAAGETTLDVQLSVMADSLESAVAKARAAFVNALRRAGGPKHPDLIEAEVKTAERLDAELATPNVPELIGITELGQLLGVPRQRAYQLSKQKGFPEPLTRLASGPVWNKINLTWWLEDWRQRRRRRLTSTDPVSVVKIAARA